MDPLASSHTAGTQTARRLLIMFVALVFFRHGIVVCAAGALLDVDRNTQGVASVSEDSLARLGIWADQAGPHDLLDGIGSDGRSDAEVRPPAIEMRRVEGWRKMLGDISPPGMWPTPDGQDVPPVVNDEFRRRSLLTGSTPPPPLGGPLFMVLHSSEDGEDAFLRQALAADKTYPVVQWALIVSKLKQLGSLINRSSVLGFRMSLPFRSSVRVNAVVAKDISEPIDNGDDHQHLRTSQDTVESEMQSGMQSSTTGHFGESTSLQQKLRVQQPQFRSRSLLQGDISPPGMWPDADDDESQLNSESLLLRRRRLLNM